MPGCKKLATLRHYNTSSISTEGKTWKSDLTFQKLEFKYPLNEKGTDTFGHLEICVHLLAVPNPATGSTRSNASTDKQGATATNKQSAKPARSCQHRLKPAQDAVCIITSPGPQKFAPICSSQEGAKLQQEEVIPRATPNHAPHEGSGTKLPSAMHILNVAPSSLEGMAKQRRSAGSLRQSDQNFKLCPALRNPSLLVSRLASRGGEITSADTEQQFHPAGRFLSGESYDITRGTAEHSLLCSAAPTSVPWEGARTMSWKRSPALPQLEWLVTVSPNVKKREACSQSWLSESHEAGAQRSPAAAAAPPAATCQEVTLQKAKPEKNTLRIKHILQEGLHLQHKACSTQRKNGDSF
ncbi:hypothetical protein Anapl_05877 [Anas platyrhynchos]|uniref:Uncharacterized protein n=1 Tax=Anas platyrhynchos TaxID=8839 RepID=R0M7D0_ANAPL|nr:hypothetical protein Anapl_05877 [Anas platyrhynchos]